MPISHPRRVSPVQRPISLPSQPLFIHALSLHRPRDLTLRQPRFVRSFMFKKEVPVLSPTPCSPAATGATSISARRLGRDMPSLHSRPTFSVYRDAPPPVLSIRTPLPNLITPSKFSSPFTPANQILHTPFQPPEPHKGTPSKRHRNHDWQWSPVLVPRLTSPGIDENSPPTTPDSPIYNLNRRLSLIRPPASSMHVPRRLSYSQACASPWTPDSSHGQALASPVLIRSALWTPTSPVASPRYQLDDLHFSPFHVASF
ncbi:hypothetical protein DFH09DRAFT_1321036 [Mycena vulgaris]|nr:hypothetical protein DFH09DRAFT_1321036 [Mycena vulgaris]